MFHKDCLQHLRIVLVVVFIASLSACGVTETDKGGDVLDENETTGSDQNNQLTESGTIPLSLIQSGARKLDTGDPSAPFTSNLPSNVDAVTVNSPAVLHFAITDQGGNVITGLQGSDLRFAVAKLVPGSRGQVGVAGSGNPDQWVSYIYRTKSGTAVTDGVQATFENGADGNLAYDAENKYYSYTFATDLETATRPDSDDLIWDDTATHRIAIQLDIEDDNGNRILFNPHFDFTFDGGHSVPLTDLSRTHLVVDESSCNECHNQLTAHGGRVETEYCVMCHNSGSIDVEFGSELDFKIMIHKIHKGRALENPYQIMGYGDRIHDWSEVGYPQDLRNCSKCHDGDNPLTPQGENYRLQPTQQACGSCHESVDFNNHQGYDMIDAQNVPDNSRCGGCHAGPQFAASFHLNQAQQDSGNYQFNIHDFNYDASSRALTVSYSITNPNNGQAYDVVEGLESCLADVNNGISQPNDCRDLEGAPFSRFTLYIASLTMPGATASVDDFSDHSVSLFAWQGADNGDGSYTATLSVPAEAVGTARFLSSGQAQERKITNLLAYNSAKELNTVITESNAAENGVDWDWNNRVRVPISNGARDFSVDGSPLKERRNVVADAKCNACHGLLGTASGSNTLANAFHRGERSSVNACPICHTPNRASSTEMSDEDDDGTIIEPLIPGTMTRMNQSFEFKNMIHGIHGGEVRSTAYMEGTEDLSGETHYPGMIGDCTVCHEGDSFNLSQGKLGAAVSREDEIETRRVFSPFAASCMGCHDQARVRDHMSTVGGASVADFTQEQWLAGAVYERCGECHGPGAAKDIARVHDVN
jgi:OmcA/MtrC family decaheme c-type cytochrome